MVNLWFPAFRLRENPFRYTDAVVELEAQTVPSIETAFLYQVGSFIEGGVSSVIVGERGAGKSKLAAQVRGKGEVVIFDKQNWEHHEIEIGEKKVKAFGGTESEAIFQTVDRFPNKARVLVDFPDDLDRTQVREWIGAIRSRLRGFYDRETKQRGLATIIILCNEEQYAFLKKFDAIARLPRIDFPRADKKFLTQLYNDRIKAFGDTGSVSPFRPEVVDRLTELSDTPRSFLQTCSLVLTRMWIDNFKEEVKEPCGLDYLDSLKELHQLNQMKAQKNEAELLRETIDDLRKQNRIWIKGKEIVRLLAEKHHLETTPDRIGRLLQRSGFEKRRNPDTEYRIG